MGAARPPRTSSPRPLANVTARIRNAEAKSLGVLMIMLKRCLRALEKEESILQPLLSMNGPSGGTNY